MKKFFGSASLILGIPGTILGLYDIISFTNNWNTLLSTGKVTTGDLTVDAAAIAFLFVVSVFLDIVGVYLLK